MIKIIAEAGVNHNGSLDTALKMVDAAVRARADYIKFQTFKTDSLVTASCRAAGYQNENAGETHQASMLRKLELPYADFITISDYCREKGIGFLSTPFDFESIEFLASLKPDFMKVPSGEITNLPYLRKIASTHIPVIISTGMCGLPEIEAALLPFKAEGYGKESLTLMHCTTQYPTPLCDVNLRAMHTLEEIFGYPAGYSDHTAGITVAIAAAALGASVIEKHFTLDRNMEGPDHKASLEPSSLGEMVKAIREVEEALGTPEKRMTESDRKNITAARRSIFAARFIKAGKVIEEADICAKRPGNGLSPMMWDKVAGSVAKRDFLPDEAIEI